MKGPLMLRQIVSSVAVAWLTFASTAIAAKAETVTLEAYSDGHLAWSIVAQIRHKVCVVNGKKVDDCSELRTLTAVTKKVLTGIKSNEISKFTHPEDEFAYFVSIDKKRGAVAFKAPEICEIAKDGSRSCVKNELSSAERLLLILRKFHMAAISESDG